MAFRTRWLAAVSLALGLALGSAVIAAVQRPERMVEEEVYTPAGRHRLGRTIDRHLAAADDATRVGNCAVRDTELESARALIDRIRRVQVLQRIDGFPPEALAEYDRRHDEIQARRCPPDGPGPQPQRLVPPTALPCPTAMPGRGASLHCRCPVGPYRRTVWGTHYYAADSGLCAAARHAGVIGDNGGPILARVEPGRGYYVGTTRNGITSRPQGGAIRTIIFDGASDPVEARRGRVPLCQFKYSVYPAADQQRPLTCRCIRGHFGFEGAVYGAGPYAPDSSICTAARHAGALTGNDGLVTVSPAPGLRSYRGSVRNGVISQDWLAPYPISMTLVRAPG